MTSKRLLGGSVLALALLPLLVRAADCDQGGRLYEQAMASADLADKTQLLERSVEVCPETLAYYQLGVARLASNEPQAAAAALRQALGLVKDDPQVQGSILGRQAQAHLALGEVAEALAAADTARALFARGQAGRPVAKGLAAAPGPAWFAMVQKDIDRSPERQDMSAETIGRFFTAQRNLVVCGEGEPCERGFDPRPRLDLYILFDTNQDQPNAAGLKSVAELGRYLAGASKAFDPRPRPGPGSSTAPSPSPGAGTVGLIGHTDQCAEESFNQDLSERRARNVAALIERDYPALRGRLRSEGRGEREPRYPSGNQRPDCDQPLNRRVAVVMPQ